MLAGDDRIGAILLTQFGRKIIKTKHIAGGNYRKPAIKSADAVNSCPNLIGIYGYGNVYLFNHSIFTKSETAANVSEQKFIKSPLIGKLTKIAKHSAAQNAKITLAICADAITLTVEDDGSATGHPFTEGSGIGLLGISEPVTALDGQLTLAIAQPHGLKVEVWLPP